MGKRNEQAHALHFRAGNACVAVAVDTRPKRTINRKAYSRKVKHPGRAD